jgi:hypothetical protein
MWVRCVGSVTGFRVIILGRRVCLLVSYNHGQLEQAQLADV